MSDLFPSIGLVIAKTKIWRTSGNYAPKAISSGQSTGETVKARFGLADVIRGS